MSIEDKFQNNAIQLLKTLRNTSDLIECVVPPTEECLRLVDEGNMGRVEALRYGILWGQVRRNRDLIDALLATDPTYASLLPKDVL